MLVSEHTEHSKVHFQKYLIWVLRDQYQSKIRWRSMSSQNPYLANSAIFKRTDPNFRSTQEVIVESELE